MAEPWADASNAAEESAARARTGRKGAKEKPAARRGENKSGKKKRSTAGLKPAAEPAAVAAGRAPKPRPKTDRSAKRKPPRQTFLVAATIATGDGPPRLRVYAAVVRGAAEALAAVRAELGPEVPVELTGKLSNRMAKALGLKPDAVRPV